MPTSTLAPLKALTHLALHENKFTGPLPQVQHPLLETFDASHNAFSGSILDFPVPLPRLGVYRVAMNKLTSLPSFVTADKKACLPVVREITLGGNAFADASLPQVCR